MEADALYVSALLRRGSVQHLRGVSREHMTEQWRPVHDFVSWFARSYGALPHLVTAEQQFPGLKLPEAPEEVAFYAGKVRDNAMRAAMEKGLVETVARPLAEHKPDEAVAGAKQVLADVSREFLRDAHRGLMIEAAQDVGERAADYNLRKRMQDATGVPFFLPTFTRCAGGMQPGEVWAIIARPNMGKTWAACAQTIFLYQTGWRVLFVSQETPPRNALPKDPRHRVVQGKCVRCAVINPNMLERCEAALTPRQRLTIRMDALAARVCARRTLKGLLNPHEERQLFRYYEMAQTPHAFGWGNYRIVAPPLVNNIADVEMECHDFQPDLLVWDSPFMSVSGKDKKSRKEATDELVAQMKRDLAERLGIPLLCTWHFNREVDEKATEASMGDAMLSDDVARMWDGLIGMLRPPEVRDARECLWQPLKVRDGVFAPKIKSYFQVEDAIRFEEIGPVEVRAA